MDRYKTWTLGSGMDYGLDYGLDFGLEFGQDSILYELTSLIPRPRPAFITCRMKKIFFVRRESLGTRLQTNLVFWNFPGLQFLIASSLVPKVRIIQILQCIWQRSRPRQ